MATAQALAESISMELRQQIGTALNEYAIQKRDEIREAISVPVVYVFSTGEMSNRSARPKRIGANAGPGLTNKRKDIIHVIRSKVGEPPRKEYGDLWRSVSAVTTEDENHIRASVFSDGDTTQANPTGGTIGRRAAILESRFSRPHFSTAAVQMEDEALPELEKRISF